ncbi:hypothetical protein THII_3353 [Thioploca ingrica]|uniref:DUF29 domain-containing protein n=1 Tax=Thioploca ingrica TaxID=40754 RepID=A0A090APY8_9GAMM|nr:hypothetical protein THII_3353 [Thioploca ingrica]
MMDLEREYNQDFHQWIEHHITLLREGRLSEIDTGHLIEELEDMARRDRDELVSRLVILMAHLLKWQFQLSQLSEQWKEFDGRSWRRSIIEQRNEILRQLRNKPSLKSYLPDAVVEAYPDAVKIAAQETRLAPSTFPSENPYAIEQLLDEDFYPLS